MQRPTRTTRCGLAAAVLLALVTSGCTDDSGDGSDIPRVTAPVSTSASPTPSPTPSPKAGSIKLDGANKKLPASALGKYEKGRSHRTAGPQAEKGKQTLQVMGDCSDKGGLWFRVRGFTPGGDYGISATYPKDSAQKGGPYDFVMGATVKDDGSTPTARWNCAQTDTGSPDPAGIYEVTFIDVESRADLTTQFVVDSRTTK